MKKRVVVGSRGSPLAVIQAQIVINNLTKLYPDMCFILEKIVTKGDRHKDVSLDKIPEMGVFVSEVQKALLENKIDLAVHSLKDLPVQSDANLSMGAIVRRLDPRDVLVSRGKRLKELPPNSVIGTGSLRRTAQLRGIRPELKPKPIRGNIHTRLERITNGEVDAIIIAAAAMIRLKLEEKITEYLSPHAFLPSPGQGALAVEVRTDDSNMKKLILPLDHDITRQCVMAERTFLETMGGGCTTPIGSLGVVTENTLALKGMTAAPDRLLYATELGHRDSWQDIGKKLASKLRRKTTIPPQRENKA